MLRATNIRWDTDGKDMSAKDIYELIQTLGQTALFNRHY